MKTSGALQDAEQQLALLVLLVLIVFFLFSPTPISPPHRYRDQLTYHTYYHCPTLGIFFVFVAVVFFLFTGSRRIVLSARDCPWVLEGSAGAELR